MDKEKNVENLKQKALKQEKENWMDEVMKRQEHDLEVEEEFLSIVPNRLKHKYLEEEDEE